MLAGERGSYVISVLDCCREKLDKLMRGASDAVMKYEEDFDRFNFIVTYGCAPSQGTPAKSTISEAYFLMLKLQADAYTGEVTLPNAFDLWQGFDGKSETLHKVR